MMFWSKQRHSSMKRCFKWSTSRILLRLTRCWSTPHTSYSSTEFRYGLLGSHGNRGWNLVYCETKTPRDHQLGELEHYPVGKWRTLLLRNDSPAESANRARRHGISAINFYTRLNEHQFGSSKYRHRHGERDHDRFWEGGQSTQETLGWYLPLPANRYFPYWKLLFLSSNFKTAIAQKLCGGFCWNLNVYVGKMIIKAAKRIFNSDKILRSCSDLNFGVTFLEHSVLLPLAARRS